MIAAYYDAVNQKDFHSCHRKNPALALWMILEAVTTLEKKLARKIQNIMSKIADFAAAMSAFNDRVDAAITDLQGDVKSLNDQITALQNSAGTVTAEDQALLDALQARASSIADKLDALDALTPPAAPPAS